MRRTEPIFQIGDRLVQHVCSPNSSVSVLVGALVVRSRLIIMISVICRAGILATAAPPDVIAMWRPFFGRGHGRRRCCG